MDLGQQRTAFEAWSRAHITRQNYCSDVALVSLKSLISQLSPGVAKNTILEMLETASKTVVLTTRIIQHPAPEPAKEAASAWLSQIEVVLARAEEVLAQDDRVAKLVLERRPWLLSRPLSTSLGAIVLDLGQHLRKESGTQTLAPVVRRIGRVQGQGPVKKL